MRAPEESGALDSSELGLTGTRQLRGVGQVTKDQQPGVEQRCSTVYLIGALETLCGTATHLQTEGRDHSSQDEYRVSLTILNRSKGPPPGGSRVVVVT